MTTDYSKPTDFHQLQESWLDAIHGRHRVRFRSDHHTHQHTHCQHNIYKHLTDGRQSQHTKGQDAQQLQSPTWPHSMQNHTKKQHKESKHLWSSSQTLKWGDNFLHTKHKQKLWKEHLDAHWDHRHNTHILWNTIHGLSNRAPTPTLNTSITFNNKIATTPKHIANCFTKQFTTTVKYATHKTNISLTEQHIKYKDITPDSQQLRSKRQ